jgi:colanic acid/amylovoran biosynthesis protein
MNILISHVYSRYNNGDSAILSAQIGDLRTTFPDLQLHILTIETIEPDYEFDGVPVCNALMYGVVSATKGRLAKLLLAVVMVVYTTLWAIAFRVGHTRLPLPGSWRKPMRLLTEANMQVCVGGGYLRAKNDLVSTILLLLLVHQIWLAKVLGKPVYLYAQSFGPYPWRTQRTIASLGLRCADLILVREGKSRALLGQLGLIGERIVQVPDSAFRFSPRVSPSFRPLPLLGTRRHCEQLIGITVRSWLPDSTQQDYERAMAEFIDCLSQRDDLRVAVIPQVTSAEQNDDDRVTGRRIQQMLKRRGNAVFLDDRFTHHEITSLFAELDYLVGTRFHSVIFALTAGVPALAIEYEHKTSGVMSELGLEEWVLGIEDVTADRLMTLFERLLCHRDDYVRTLHRVIPSYVHRAGETAGLIRQAYEGRQGASGGAPRSPRGAAIGSSQQVPRA